MTKTQPPTATRTALPAIVTYTLLSTLTPATAFAQSTVYVHTTVRDFEASHPDMAVTTVSPTAHHAGTTGLVLTDNRPTFSAGGFAVPTEWTGSGGENISPHMYREPSGTTLRVVRPPKTSTGVTIDTWDWTAGPYPAGAGPAPSFETRSVLPPVSVPFVGPSIGDLFIPASTPLSGLIHCDRLEFQKEITVTITGPTTIVCDEFYTNRDMHIEIAPGGRLDLYVLNTGWVNQRSTINMNTWDPTLCTIYYLGTDTFHLNQSTKVCARIVAPYGTTHLHQDDHVYGTIMSYAVTLDQNTGIHAIGVGAPTDVCGVSVTDTLGAAGAAGSGGITSSATFGEWFRDVLGVNQSTIYTLPLTDVGGGIYEFRDNDFHPIDDMMFGNEGNTHNEHFTVSIHARFFFSACSGQFIRVSGGDGLWVYIDGSLVIDLGGLDNTVDQFIDLDRLGGLVDGGMHELHMFYASRNATDSSFELVTNLELISDELPLSITGIAD